MISYAQNFEDVILERALGHVQQGFYIDLGAAHPVSDSVTCHFYNKGWHGVNVEPNPEYFSELQWQRTRDINVPAGVASISGTMTYFRVPDSGLSTFDVDLGESYLAEFNGVEVSKVKVFTLDEVISLIPDEIEDVHFMKIDVEGLETDIISQLTHSESLKPWILIVEATEPRTQISNFDKWEHMVLDFGYMFVYDDGLNRFYLSKLKNKLRSHFAYPPNIFDGFEKYSAIESESERDIALAERDIALAERDIALAERDIALAELRNITASRIWRWTKILRSF